VKLRIYPKKSAVIEILDLAILRAESDGDTDRSLLLNDYMRLVESHCPPEIAVEIEDELG
jgi:hypothetical protein